MSGVQMNILCIDAAWSGSTGWVRQVDDGVEMGIDYGTLKADEAKHWLKRFDLFNYDGTFPKYLVIEDTYLQYYPVKKQPADYSKPKQLPAVQSYGLLCRAKQLWISDAIDHFNILPENIIEVSPQTWQKGLQRNWKFGAGSKKNMPEIENYIRLRWKLGNVKLTEHEISAFGLLSYFIDHIQNTSYGGRAD